MATDVITAVLRGEFDHLSAERRVELRRQGGDTGAKLSADSEFFEFLFCFGGIADPRDVPEEVAGAIRTSLRELGLNAETSWPYLATLCDFLASDCDVYKIPLERFHFYTSDDATDEDVDSICGEAARFFDEFARRVGLQCSIIGTQCRVSDAAIIYTYATITYTNREALRLAHSDGVHVAQLHLSGGDYWPLMPARLREPEFLLKEFGWECGGPVGALVRKELLEHAITRSDSSYGTSEVSKNAGSSADSNRVARRRGRANI